MKKFISAIFVLTCLLLCSCSLYNKEYRSVEDYEIPSQTTGTASSESVNVSNITQLRSALIRMIYSSASEGRITFASDYNGDVASDIESACWQVRTQDAVSAYCVRNISYELDKIVSYYEAALDISYYESAMPADEIVMKQYAAGIEELLLAAMQENDARLVICVNNSSLTKSSLESMITDVYRNNPAAIVTEPDANVLMYSGSGKQRLYEINFDYKLETDEILRRRSLLMNLDISENIGLEEDDSDAVKAYRICKYFVDSGSIVSDSGADTVYDAIIRFNAGDEGYALAFEELCRQVGIECDTVYGQKGGRQYCWNIANIEGDYYHIDVCDCITSGIESGFLLNDVQKWNTCRWNTSSYHSCSGKLEYDDIQQIVEQEPYYFDAETEPEDIADEY